MSLSGELLSSLFVVSLPATVCQQWVCAFLTMFTVSALMLLNRGFLTSAPAELPLNPSRGITQVRLPDHILPFLLLLLCSAPMQQIMCLHSPRFSLFSPHATWHFSSWFISLVFNLSNYLLQYEVQDNYDVLFCHVKTLCSLPRRHNIVRL